MKTILITAFLTFLAAATPSQAQPAAIPELEALNHYAGHWKTTLSLKKEDGEEILTGRVSAKWILEGRFLQQTSTVLVKDKDPISITTLSTFDPTAKTYQHWSFTSLGTTSSGTGTWDADSKTFSWTTTDAKNNTTTKVTSTFADADKEEWLIVTEDATGKTTGMITGSNSRTKKHRADQKAAPVKTLHVLLSLLLVAALLTPCARAVPNSFFGNGVIVIPAHPRFNADLTRDVLASANWETNHFPGPWEPDTALQGHEVNRMTALPTLFGSTPDSVVAYSENGTLKEIAITYLDAGSFFGFKAGGEKSHQDRLNGAGRRSEFNRLFHALSNDLRSRLEQGCGPGQQNTVGRSDLLRQVFTDYRFDDFVIRLAKRPNHSVSLHLLRPSHIPRSYLDDDLAPLSPSQRAQRLTDNVRRNERGDVFVDALPMFKQGHTPFCGIHSLAMAAHYYGLRLRADDLAAGAAFRNTGSARGSNILALYHAAAEEIDLKLSVSSRFNFDRVQRALEAGRPVIVWRRVSAQREKAHANLATHLAHNPMASLPPPSQSDSKTYPPRDRKGSPSHASIITGINPERNEVLFTEPWGEHARDRRMRAEEMEASAYAIFFFKE